MIGREVLNFLKGGAVEDSSEAHVVALRCAFVGAGGWLIPFIGDNMKFLGHFGHTFLPPPPTLSTVSSTASDPGFVDEELGGQYHI